MHAATLQCKHSLPFIRCLRNVAVSGIHHRWPDWKDGQVEKTCLVYHEGKALLSTRLLYGLVFNAATPIIDSLSPCIATVANESDDATTGARQRHTGGGRRRGSASRTHRRGDGRRRNSTCSSSSLSDDNEPRRKPSSSGGNSKATIRNRDETGSDGSPKRKTAKKKDRGQKERHQRRQIDSDIDAVLSSSSGSGGGEGDENLDASGRKSRKGQSRLKPKPASEEQMLQARDRYREGDTVEARFGGRSKWFPGKVGRSREAEVRGGGSKPSRARSKS